MAPAQSQELSAKSQALTRYRSQALLLKRLALVPDIYVNRLSNPAADNMLVKALL